LNREKGHYTPLPEGMKKVTRGGGGGGGWGGGVGGGGGGGGGVGGGGLSGRSGKGVRQSFSEGPHCSKQGAAGRDGSGMVRKKGKFLLGLRPPEQEGHLHVERKAGRGIPLFRPCCIGKNSSCPHLPGMTRRPERANRSWGKGSRKEERRGKTNTD